MRLGPGLIRCLVAVNRWGAHLKVQHGLRYPTRGQFVFNGVSGTISIANDGEQIALRMLLTLKFCLMAD